MEPQVGEAEIKQLKDEGYSLEYVYKIINTGSLETKCLYCLKKSYNNDNDNCYFFVINYWFLNEQEAWQCASFKSRLEKRNKEIMEMLEIPEEPRMCILSAYPK